MKEEIFADDLSDERLRALPQRPGVYLMRDKKSEVIYVGKARNLRVRVRQYFSGQDNRVSIPYLLERMSSIETIVTEDERQALILESDLIRQYKPRYNIRLKDDRAYLLVRIDRDADWPKLELVRADREDGATYLGPFAFGYELRSLLETIQRTVPLRTCSDHVLRNRVRPCIEFQIKRCSGPCCLPVEREEYDRWIEQALRILEGKDAEVIDSLELQMQRASDELRFEDAALLRDRIAVLRRVHEDRTQVRFGTSTQHAFGIYREGANVEVALLMVRRGRLFESKSYGFRDVFVSDGELLDEVIGQFYATRSDVPDTILVPVEPDGREAREAVLAERRGGAVHLHLPKLGPKARLLELACANAQQNFRARFREEEGGGDLATSRLAAALQLPETPRLIECVDISHLQGTSVVASVVCFADGRPEKSRYRHFVLSVEQNDDFAAMREVITRHLSRGAEENTLADLLVVDGGPPQLREAERVMRDLGLQQPQLLSLAKKRSERVRPAAGERLLKQIRERKPERVYLQSRGAPIVLDPHSDALHLLERLRDEAHRFAITFHRSRRAKRMLRSPLEQVPGLGPKRRQQLLRAFGSVRALKAAAPEEVAERAAIPLALAVRILRHLHKDQPEE